MFNIQSWSTEFFQKATEAMSKEMSSIFLRMCLLDEEPKESLNLQEVQGEFLYQIIDKRAEHIGLTLSEPAKIFLMILAQSPGSAVMYLYALRSKTTVVNMKVLAQMFPVGFLPQNELSKMWDKQKGVPNKEDVDNCLDFYKFS